MPSGLPSAGVSSHWVNPPILQPISNSISVMADLSNDHAVSQKSWPKRFASHKLTSSQAHKLTGGHRGFDILHVAAAKVTGATHFLTFDVNQKKLAERVGLVVPL